MNFVPCVTWVAKGIAKSHPDKVQLKPEELKALIDETKEDIRNHASSDNEQGDENISKNEEDVNDEDNDDLDDNDDPDDNDEDFDAKYNLDAYDDDDDERPFMNVGDITVFADNKDDEYITGYDAVKEDEKEEEEDFVIKENDNLLVVGHVEEESSVLEIYVYNKEEKEFYVHHDIVLPAYPLALEWLNFHPSDETPGNYVAVGDMSPVIKIWDLDVADILEPDYCLGEKKKKKIEQKSKLKSHSDAVLSLSWNKHVNNILASGSADSTIVLWDLQDGRAANRLRFHTNKVQTLQWSSLENSYLLSGCTDGLVKLYDCRTDTECKTWTIDGEIERVLWDLSDSSKFFCSTDAGFLYSFDMRKDEIEHSVQAHSEGVTGLDLCLQRPNVLVTGSMDKTIKLWNIENGFNLLSVQKLKVGSIYTTKFAPDLDLVLAVGGNYASHSLKIIDDLAEKLDGVHNEGEDTSKKYDESFDSKTDFASQVNNKDNFQPKKAVKKFKSEKDHAYNTQSEGMSSFKKKKKTFHQPHQNAWTTYSSPSTSYDTKTQRLQNNVKKYE